MNTKDKVLLISPHLDDAVFSAGGLAAILATQGHEVHILTCFTQSVDNPKGFALDCQLDKGLPAEVDYMQLRRQEDQEACRLLGAVPHWGDLPEAPHRGYENATELFQKLKNKDKIAENLLKMIQHQVEKIQPQLVFSPLGIGNHVDHQQVYRAMEQIHHYFPEVLYFNWYDQPYLMRNPEQLDQKAFLEIDLNINQLKAISDEKRSEPTCFDLKSVKMVKFQACAAYKSQVDFQFAGSEQLAAYFQDSAAGENKFEEYFVAG